MVKVFKFDECKTLYFPGNYEASLLFSLEEWVKIARQSIEEKGFFTVALSGGKTPIALFQLLKNKKTDLDFSNIYFFWSDERGVLPTNPESNYRSALEDGELKSLGIPDTHIFRMQAEDNLITNAQAYERLIHTWVPQGCFDLIMLGMGNDGHTASLFPGSVLIDSESDVTAGYVGKDQGNRMSLTFACINRATSIFVYIFGKGKGTALSQILPSQDFKKYPVLGVGTKNNPAHWIIDDDASTEITSLLS